MGLSGAFRPVSTDFTALGSRLVGAGAGTGQTAARDRPWLAQSPTAVCDGNEIRPAQGSLCAWRLEEPADGPDLLPASRRGVDAAGTGGATPARSLSTNGQHNGQHDRQDHKNDDPVSAEMLTGSRDSRMGLGRVELPTSRLSDGSSPVGSPTSVRQIIDRPRDVPGWAPPDFEPCRH
jgi:hypothetical protein